MPNGADVTSIGAAWHEGLFGVTEQKVNPARIAEIVAIGISAIEQARHASQVVIRLDRAESDTPADRISKIALSHCFISL